MGLTNTVNIGKRFGVLSKQRQTLPSVPQKGIVGSWLNGFKAKRELTPKLLPHYCKIYYPFC
jgi:hypothetical protein